MRRIALAVVLSAFTFGATATAPSDLEAQCTYCSLCSGGHQAYLSGTSVTSFHSLCLAVECGHPPCGVGLVEPAAADEVEDMRSLLLNAAEGDVVAVANIIERAGGRAFINYARGALQIRGGCDQQDLAEAPVIIHIPLNQVQLAAAANARTKSAALAFARTPKTVGDPPIGGDQE